MGSTRCLQAHRQSVGAVGLRCSTSLCSQRRPSQAVDSAEVARQACKGLTAMTWCLKAGYEDACSCSQNARAECLHQDEQLQPSRLI